MMLRSLQACRAFAALLLGLSFILLLTVTLLQRRHNRLIKA